MAAKIGSAEHAREGKTDKDDRSPLSPGRSSTQPLPSRHLYIIHSTDAPGHPSLMARHPPALRGRRSQGMLDRSVQGQIGRMLRDVFADVAEDPVPDRFVKLLEALEAKEKRS